VLTKRSWVLVGALLGLGAALLGLGACVLETKNVPGEKGDPGAKGDDGQPGEPGLSPFIKGPDGSIFYMDGRVGIGTMTPNTIPETKLDVSGGIAVDGQRVLSSSGKAISVGDLAGGDGSRDLVLYAGDEPRLWIAQGSGFVGIGTDVPAAALDVNGRFLVHNVSDQGDAYSIESRRSDDSAPTRIRSSSDGDIRFEVATDQFASSELASALYVRRGRMVGVNTDLPIATLDVNGTARLAKYDSPPVACDQVHDATIALNTKYQTCVCNGNSGQWVRTSDGSTACSVW
jgi:hypothetical protein